jgi:hypothetical protein
MQVLLIKMERRYLFLIVLAGLGCSHTDELSQKSPSLSAPSQTTLQSPLDLASRADVDLYPGASIPDGQSNMRSDKGQSRYEIKMNTSDSPDKVLKFYRAKLKGAEQMPGNDNVMGMTPKGYFASVKAKAFDGKTAIAIVVTDEKG